MPVRFPAESARYRTARTKLLKAEVDLRAQIERVAVLRRKLPLGGAVAQDYVFAEGAADLADETTTRRVKLSKLFAAGKGKDTLVLYSFMYGPDRKEPCPMCTCMLDSLDRTAPHASQRINLAVVAKSPIERVRAFARRRGWSSLRLLSSHGSSYNRDYFGEDDEGNQWPMLNVFVRRQGRIHHFWGTELLYEKERKGQDGRHVDLIWPLWNLLDFTPEGRGADWYPALRY